MNSDPTNTSKCSEPVDRDSVDARPTGDAKQELREKIAEIIYQTDDDWGGGGFEECLKSSDTILQLLSDTVLQVLDELEAQKGSPIALSGSDKYKGGVIPLSATEAKRKEWK